MLSFSRQALRILRGLENRDNSVSKPQSSRAVTKKNPPLSDSLQAIVLRSPSLLPQKTDCLIRMREQPASPFTPPARPLRRSRTARQGGKILFHVSATLAAFVVGNQARMATPTMHLSDLDITSLKKLSQPLPRWVPGAPSFSTILTGSMA